MTTSATPGTLGSELLRDLALVAGMAVITALTLFVALAITALAAVAATPI